MIKTGVDFMGHHIGRRITDKYLSHNYNYNPKTRYRHEVYLTNLEQLMHLLD
jgi:hypothetical protein